jgi:hypothetical protein
MIKQIENDIKAYLLDEKSSSDLEIELTTLSKSFKEMFITATIISLIAVIIYYLNQCPSILIIIVLLGIILYLFEEITFHKGRKLNILSRYISNYLSKQIFQALNESLTSFYLKSLRNLEWYLKFSIKLNLKKNNVYTVTFRYQNGSIGRTISKKTNTINYFELLPNVYIGYEFLKVNIKCDFRIIRSFMTKEEVGSLFTKISEHLPGLKLSNIVIRQYSSTKECEFTMSDLDSDIIANCRKNKVYYYSRPNNTRSDRGKVKSNSALKSISSYKRTREKPDLIKLQEIQEMRKKTEKIAMKTVHRYEEGSNNKVKDVSLENVGYDLISIDPRGNEKFIEVKGLSSQGDVILTENEITTLLNNPSTYYIYVVDNCLNTDESRLYILNSLDISDFKKTAAEYSINLIEQEEKADNICLL